MEKETFGFHFVGPGGALLKEFSIDLRLDLALRKIICGKRVW